MNKPARVARAPAKPLMIFDGDCGFCRRWIGRWVRKSEGEVDYVPFQDPQVATRFPELKPEQFAGSVHLIEPDGRVCRGAEAVFRSRQFKAAGPVRPGGSPLCRQPVSLWLYRHAPGFATASEWAYRLVARHRGFLSRFMRPG